MYRFLAPITCVFVLGDVATIVSSCARDCAGPGAASAAPPPPGPGYGAGRNGRQAVAAHGPREMPVWGNENEVDITTGFRVNPKDLESYVRGRIIALIGYIYTLQEK